MWQYDNWALNHHHPSTPFAVVFRSLTEWQALRSMQASNFKPEQWGYVKKNDPQLYNQLSAVQRELIARKWAKEHRYFWGEQRTLQNAFFHHFISLCRQPRGRADGERGSQQCLFEMELPTHQCHLEMLGVINSDFRCMGKTRYTVNAQGQVEWVKSSSVESYFMQDAQQMSNYLRFHEREASRQSPCLPSHQNFTCMFSPPLFYHYYSSTTTTTTTCTTTPPPPLAQTWKPNLESNLDINRHKHRTIAQL